MDLAVKWRRIPSDLGLCFKTICLNLMCFLLISLEVFLLPLSRYLLDQVIAFHRGFFQNYNNALLVPTPEGVSIILL